MGRLRVLFTASLVLAVALCIGTAVEKGYAQTDEGVVEVEPASPQATTVVLKKLLKTISVTEPGLIMETSATFVDIPGASVIFNVKPGTGKRAVHVVLSGCCAIDGAGAEEDVVVRVLIDGVEMLPGPTTWAEDFSDNLAIPQWGSSLHFVTAEKVKAGTHTVTAQWLVQGGATAMLQNYNFMVNIHK
jgi:hypothetical protein